MKRNLRKNKGGSERVPVMQGRKGNLKSKRWGNKRCRKLPLRATPKEIKIVRYKNEKIAEIPKYPFN